MNHCYRLAHSPHPSASPRFSAVAFAFVLMAGLFSPASAVAQRAGLPADLKSAVDARPRSAEIIKFVTEQVASLKKDDDPSAQQKARDALIRDSTAVGTAPGASYAEIYGKALNDHLVELAKSKSVRTRLNAAIVTQRASKNLGNGALADAAAVFAEDPCVGVVLWAMKAAQSALPPLAAAGTPTRLTAAVVEGVRKHSTSRDVADEAYRAATLGFSSNTRVVTPAAVPVVLDDVLRLFEFRVSLYEKTTPPQPDLDRNGVNFLTLSRVWSTKEGTKQRSAIMQQLSNLLGLSAQHATARPETDRRDFIEQMRGIGNALIEVAKRPDVKDPALQATGKALTELQATMAETEINERAAAAFAAIQKKFPDTKPAPTLAPGATEETLDEIAEDESSMADDAAVTAGEDDGARPGASAPTDRRQPERAPPPRRRYPAGEEPEAP